MLIALKLPDGGCTTTIPQTLQLMIDSLKLSDTTVDEDDHQNELCALTAIRQVAHPEVNAFTIADVNAAILSISKRKAPGDDRITTCVLVESLLVLAPTPISTVHLVLKLRCIPVDLESSQRCNSDR